MTWSVMDNVPNPLFDANGNPYSGAVLKAYLPGTTTVTSIAIDSSGSSPQSSLTANAEGKWEVSGNEVLPYIDREHKWGIFADATAAAANTPFYMGPFDNVSQVLDSSTAARAISTKVAMVSDTLLSLGDIINTSGYTNIDDGGGNFYEIVAAGTGTDDGGSFIDLPSTTPPLQAKALFPGGVLNAAQWGVDGLTDSASQLVKAVAYAGGRELILPKLTKLDTLATIPDDRVKLIGQGDGTTLDCSGGGGLNIFNTVTSLPSLSLNMDAGENLITFGSAHGLAVGDIVVLWNPTDFSFAPFRDYYRDGCMFKVSKVPSTTTVNTFGLAPSTFTSGAVTMHQINGLGVHLEGFRVIPNPTPSVQTIWIDAHQRVKVHDVLVDEGADPAAIEIWRCYDIDVVNVNCSSLDIVGSYPISIANSQKAVITRSQLYTLRHCFSTGGRDGTAAVPTRDLLFNNCHLFNDCDLGIGASDVHGNVENVRYSDCIINAHANIAGRNAVYKDCRILGRPASYGSGDGSVVFGGELAGGYFIFDNCEFESYGNFSTNTGGFELSVDRVVEDTRIEIRNCLVVNKHPSPASAKVVRLHVGDASPPSSQIDVVIDGLEYVANVKPVTILSLSGANDISGNLSIKIDDLTAPNGSPLVGATNAANLTAPMRLMKQQLSATISTVIGNNSGITAQLPFKYPFPKPPNHFDVSSGSTDGTAQSSSKGGKINNVWVYSYDILQMRIQLASGDGGSWSSAQNTLVWVEAMVSDF